MEIELIPGALIAIAEHDIDSHGDKLNTFEVFVNKFSEAVDILNTYYKNNPEDREIHKKHVDNYIDNHRIPLVTSSKFPKGSPIHTAVFNPQMLKEIYHEIMMSELTDLVLKMADKDELKKPGMESKIWKEFLEYKSQHS